METERESGGGGEGRNTESKARVSSQRGLKNGGVRRLLLRLLATNI